MSKLHKLLFIQIWGVGFISAEKICTKWVVSTEQSRAYFYDTRKEAIKKVYGLLSRRIYKVEEHLVFLRAEKLKLEVEIAE